MDIGPSKKEMSAYVGVWCVSAKPMTRGEYNDFRGWPVPADENPSDPGYLVEYPHDGYLSWSPADVFERAYLPLSDPTRITETEVDWFLGDFVDVETMGDKTTVVQVSLRSGYEAVASSSCVDPKNYDEDLGAGIAIGRIKNDLWGFLGFVLQWGKNGLSA